MTPHLLLLCCFLGCTQPAGDSASPEDPPLPTVEQPVVEPTLSPEDLPGLLDEALSHGFPDMFQMRGTWDRFFQAGDPLCPGTDTFMSDVALPGCTADTGWWYLGIGGYGLSEEEIGDEFVMVLSGYGDMQILGINGENLEIGGHWIHQNHFTPGHVTFGGDLSGTWRGEDTDAGWLDAGFSGWLTYSGEHYDDPESGVDTALLTGTMAMGDADLAFQDLSFGDEGCEGQPTGALRIRDDSGYWYKIDFGDACTGCGELSFGTESLNQELCVDLQGLAGQIIAAGTP